MIFHIDMNTEVFHYGETLTIAELEKKTEDKEQFQRWLNKKTAPNKSMKDDNDKALCVVMACPHPSGWGS